MVVTEPNPQSAQGMQLAYVGLVAEPSSLNSAIPYQRVKRFYSPIHKERARLRNRNIPMQRVLMDKKQHG